MMNRIYVNYTSRDGNVCSNLKIMNDIKGVTCEQLGFTYYGTEADIMLELFKNMEIRPNDKVMTYGVNIDGKEWSRNDRK